MKTTEHSKIIWTYSLKQLFKSFGWFSVLLAVSIMTYRGCSTLVTEREYELIQKGMTKREVRAILGAPHWVRDNEDVWCYYRNVFTWHQLSIFSDHLYIHFDSEELVEMPPF